MNKYTPPEIDKMLASIIILVDTREKETKQSIFRLNSFNCPYKRTKLNYGDYSSEYTGIDSMPQKIDHIACVERKMNLDELSTCFTSERNRFKREFERAKCDGCHVHLIIEQDNYEKLFNHNYRSKLLPQALIASLLSWCIRYNLQIHFCKTETTGILIKEILWYELREYLINQ